MCEDNSTKAEIGNDGRVQPAPIVMRTLKIVDFEIEENSLGEVAIKNKYNPSAYVLDSDDVKKLLQWMLFKEADRSQNMVISFDTRNAVEHLKIEDALIKCLSKFGFQRKITGNEKEIVLGRDLTTEDKGSISCSCNHCVELDDDDDGFVEDISKMLRKT